MRLLLTISWLIPHLLLAQPEDACLRLIATPVPATAATHDLDFLRPVLADKRIVLLGESSHGIGDYYTLKSRLVQYLHAELGFEVLAMESGFADIYFQYQQAATLTPVQLRDRTVFGNFQCTEIMPLFTYIHTQAQRPRPLHYAGFDSQNFGSSLDLLDTLLHTYAPAEADRIVQDLNAYYHIPPLLWQPDKTPLFAIADTIIRASLRAEALLTRYEAQLREQKKLTDTDLMILRRALRNHREAVQLDWRTANPILRRDSLMAANLFWLMDTVYPGKKCIIWGHNAHIEKPTQSGAPPAWMGHYVQARYGAQAYHIGLFARAGETYTWWTRSVDTFAQTGPSDLENRLLLPDADIVFADLSQAADTACAYWFRPMTALEVENGGVQSCIPGLRFDGLINFRTVKAPVYQR
ncbi:MAG: erythromycin esterase family protein [Bacteroidia bacterium]|nr:erythromycin esterase family protein [Bacteroidia bacterium]